MASTDERLSAPPPSANAADGPDNVASTTDGEAGGGREEHSQYASSTAASSSWMLKKLRTLLDAPPLTAHSPLLTTLLELGDVVQPDTTLEAGGVLYDELQLRAVRSSEKVARCFDKSDGVLRTMRDEVGAMQDDVRRITTRLLDARLGASAVVAQTGALRQRLATAERRRLVAQRFVRRFLLSREEEACIADGVVDERFLAVMAKLERIHLDSRSLLRSRHQRAGLEAMEAAAGKREEAYEKLYAYVQQSCGALHADASREEPPQRVLRLAIHALRSRPTLLSYCADEVGSARRALLVDSFVRALTKGDPKTLTRPIEIHSHDPMRYTNDMLAWIHDALASERELIFGLFGGGPPGGAAEDGGGGDGGEESARGAFRLVDGGADGGGDDDAANADNAVAYRVLNTVFDALCRPFRVRFEQCLEPRPAVVTLYRLASLLEFYAHTMMRYLGSKAALCNTLLECNSVAMYAFFSGWRSRMDAFASEKPVPPEDLRPPAAVQQSMARLNEIVATLDSSLSPPEARDSQIKAVLEVILKPLIALCQKMATRSLNRLEREIFMANCIDAMVSPLSTFSFAAYRAEALTRESYEHVDNYVQLATEVVLRQCGLHERVRRLNEADGSTPLAETPGMDRESLSIALKNFYALLFGKVSFGDTDSIAAPKVSRLTNARMRSRASGAVAEAVAAVHRRLYDAITDESNGYGENALAVIGARDPENVRIVLLGQL